LSDKAQTVVAFPWGAIASPAPGSETEGAGDERNDMKSWNRASRVEELSVEGGNPAFSFVLGFVVSAIISYFGFRRK